MNFIDEKLVKWADWLLKFRSKSLKKQLLKAQTELSILTSSPSVNMEEYRRILTQIKATKLALESRDYEDLERHV